MMAKYSNPGPPGVEVEEGDLTFGVVCSEHPKATLFLKVKVHVKTKTVGHLKVPKTFIGYKFYVDPCWYCLLEAESEGATNGARRQRKKKEAKP